MKKENVIILYICTGEYVAFWEEFYKSMEKHFLPNSTKEYFVFTDAESIYGENSTDTNDVERIHRIKQENLGWPGNTLYRFRMFLRVEEKLKKYDYIFFFNANIIIKKKISEDEFLPIEEDLLVVKHPGYYDKPTYEFPYERRKKSTAYIPYNEGNIYAWGGLNGGKANAFVDLIKDRADAIDDDWNKKIIAKWHDESQLNYYIYQCQKIGSKNVKVLDPIYAWAEGWNLPFECKVLVVDKQTKIKLPTKKVKANYRKPWMRLKNIYLKWKYGSKES